MYRVLLSPSGIAYAKECSEEFDNEYEFMDALRDFISCGDVVILVDELDILEDTFDREYKIEIV